MFIFDVLVLLFSCCCAVVFSPSFAPHATTRPPSKVAAVGVQEEVERGQGRRLGRVVWLVAAKSQSGPNIACPRAA